MSNVNCLNVDVVFKAVFLWSSLNLIVYAFSQLDNDDEFYHHPYHHFKTAGYKMTFEREKSNRKQTYSFINSNRNSKENNENWFPYSNSNENDVYNVNQKNSKFSYPRRSYQQVQNLRSKMIFEKDPPISIRTSLVNSNSEFFPEEKNTVSFPDSGDFVFPNSNEEYNYDMMQLKCPNNKPFCENVDNYPYEQISRLLKESNFDSRYFGNGAESTPELSLRFGHPSDDFLCSSYPLRIFPQLVTNDGQEYKLVINTKEFKQEISVEICDNKGASCKSKDPVDLSGKTECFQKTAKQRLYVVNKDSLIELAFCEFPTACVCRYI